MAIIDVERVVAEDAFGVLLGIAMPFVVNPKLTFSSCAGLNVSQSGLQIIGSPPLSEILKPVFDNPFVPKRSAAWSPRIALVQPETELPT